MINRMWRTCYLVILLPRSYPTRLLNVGHMKTLVYTCGYNERTTHVVERIIVEAERLNATSGIFEGLCHSFINRCWFCNIKHDGHFEHLLLVLYLWQYIGLCNFPIFCSFRVYSSIWALHLALSCYADWNATIGSILNIVRVDYNNLFYFVKIPLKQPYIHM